MHDYKSFLVVLTILFFNITAQGGWIITEVSKDNSGNNNVQTTFIQDNFIRHETLSSMAIIDLDSKTITIIFSQFKVYWSGTIEDLKRSSIEAYDMQMEEFLVGLTDSSAKELKTIYAETRQKLFDTSINNRVSNIDIYNTREYTRILDFNCLKYNIIVDNILRESVWHTDEVKPYNDINIENMISLMNQMESISGNNFSQTPDYRSLLATGMLLRTSEYQGDIVVNEKEVTNISEVGIPLNFFYPPDGYTEATFYEILNLMSALEK
ncbi:MAG: hypothetical protein HN336_07455 [Lentimicrobiaceae bacterium]|jgi:hypothetical protein|nr:hypothetical protein [Lentimicrobiaceae bacterium]MCP4911451.1 hypothetical protein [Bacteroidota bacterium]MBT3454601.1 hypothetical protein [Lentimicrobiaceae bacterium]MBT3818299.1 hypothetical protein [Lentimicrobiaceae bacterium]MBT4062220.1 hypothetical protein [Lentimicrobiaceae bacterium]